VNIESLPTEIVVEPCLPVKRSTSGQLPTSLEQAKGKTSVDKSEGYPVVVYVQYQMYLDEAHFEIVEEARTPPSSFLPHGLNDRRVFFWEHAVVPEKRAALPHCEVITPCKTAWIKSEDAAERKQAHPRKPHQPILKCWEAYLRVLALRDQQKRPHPRCFLASAVRGH
jgi:hypothetical protein